MTDQPNNTPDRPLLSAITGAIGWIGIIFFLADRLLQWFPTRSTSGVRQDGPCGLMVFYAAAALSGLIHVSLKIHHVAKSNSWAAEGRCPKCGYELSGASTNVCPECGPLTKPAGPVAGSPAVCARCRGDMTAREGRICVDCGAMYGMDYLNQSPTSTDQSHDQD